MVAESPSGDLMGYIMGKSEGQNENWHGHVTAVSISPEHRRLGRLGEIGHVYHLCYGRSGQPADGRAGGDI